jgi:hypothetical protein
MAHVRLYLHDLETDAFPDLCMRCASPATRHIFNTFIWLPWLPSWKVRAGMPPLMMRQTMIVPLCEKHQSHWGQPPWLMYGMLPGIALLFAIGVAPILAAPLEAGSMWSLAFMASAAILFIVWSITALVLTFLTIRVIEITDSTITFRGVHPDWIRAYQQQKSRSDDPDRRRWDNNLPDGGYRRG